MSRYKMIARTFAGAGCALLVSCYLAAPVSAGSGITANIVPPPTTYDANNQTPYGNHIVAPAIPDASGVPAVVGLNVCASAGGTSDSTCGGKCPGNCVPTKCSGTPTISCLYSCAGVPCTPPGYCMSPTLGCHDPAHGCPCTSDGDCGAGVSCVLAAHGTCDLGSYCAQTKAPDGINADDVVASADIVDGQKSKCSISGTKIAFSVQFDNAPGTIDTGLNTPLGDKTGAGRCQGGAALCVAPKGVCKADVCSGPTGAKTCVGSGASCTSSLDCTQKYCKYSGTAGHQPELGGGQKCVVDEDCPNTCAKGQSKKSICGVTGGDNANWVPDEADCLCTSDGDCGKDPSSLIPGTCVDGNEYIATLHATMGTSPTTSCIADPTNDNACVLAAGSPGGGTSVLCIAGICNGGMRNGAVCQGASDCPLGGTCVNGMSPLNPALPTKGASFVAAGNDVTPLCPFEFNLSFPMQVKAGKGQVQTDLSKAGKKSLLQAVMAPGTNVDIISCTVQEPRATGTSGISQLGLFVGSTGTFGSAKGRPQAQLVLPLPPGSTAPGNVGLGAIIGVSGGQQK
jgi:hypothetical protein